MFKVIFMISSGPDKAVDGLPEIVFTFYRSRFKPVLGHPLWSEELKAVSYKATLFFDALKMYENIDPERLETENSWFAQSKIDGKYYMLSSFFAANYTRYCGFHKIVVTGEGSEDYQILTGTGVMVTHDEFGEFLKKIVSRFL